MAVIGDPAVHTDRIVAVVIIIAAIEEVVMGNHPLNAMVINVLAAIAHLAKVVNKVASQAETVVDNNATNSAAKEEDVVVEEDIDSK